MEPLESHKKEYEHHTKEEQEFHAGEFVHEHKWGSELSDHKKIDHSHEDGIDSNSKYHKIKHHKVKHHKKHHYDS